MKKTISIVIVPLIFLSVSAFVWISSNTLSLEELKSKKLYDLKEAVKVDNKLEVYRVKTNLIDFIELINLFKNLQYLELYGLDKEVPEEISQYPNIRVLNLSNDEKLEKIDAVTGLYNLEELILKNSKVKNLPPTFKKLKKMKRLELVALNALSDIQVIENMDSLEYLDVSYSSNISKYPTTLNSIKHIKTSSYDVFINLCNTLIHSGNTSSLENIEIVSATDITQMPETAVNFSAVRKINLSNNPKLQNIENLGLFTNLEMLNITFCPNIKKLPLSFENLKKLKVLNLSNNTSLKDISAIESLPSLQMLFIPDANLLQTLSPEKQKQFAKTAIISKGKKKSSEIKYY